MNRWLVFSCTIVCIICSAFGSAAAPGSPSDVMAGLKLTAEEARALEERIARNAQDVQARGQLVVYYHRGSLLDPRHRRRHSEHVLWLVRNEPQAPVLATIHAKIDPHGDADGYTAGKHAWSSHLEREPTNVTFLRHASTFLSDHQDRALVAGALRKGQSLDADDPWWPEKLGHLHLQAAVFGRHLSEQIELQTGFDADTLELPDGLSDLLLGPQEQGDIALLALEQLKRAYELAGSDGERGPLLDGLATAALLAERYDDATGYAKAMLGTEPNRSGDQAQIHKGNIILGRVALAEEDVPQAKFHLLEAGRVSGAPTISSFGPNMRLAADLLERGETEVVLEYFELCATFWRNEKLKDWAALVKGGRAPDFGGNLFY